MGKAAGAALKVAAPEAAAAASVAGKAGGKDPRKTSPGSKAARQRQSIEDLKARRPADPPPPPSGAGEDQGDEHGGGGFSNPLAGMQGPATGGGFVLGVIVWAVARAYIGVPGSPSGAAGVRRLLLAKAFNKTK